MNQWSYTAAPCICLHGMDRDIIIFSTIPFHSFSSATLPIFPSLYYFLDPRPSFYLFFYISSFSMLPVPLEVLVTNLALMCMSVRY
jgi:hypothetical protein